MEDNRRIYRDRYAIFTVMWAFAHIAHLWNQAHQGADAAPGLTPLGVSSIIVLVAACLVALWPRKVALLIVLCSLQLIQCFISLPFAPDHWMLVTFVNLCLLTTFVVSYLRHRHLDIGQWVRDFTPPCRIVLLICYSAAAIAKFNWDFIDPSVGCAFFLSNLMTQFVPLPIPIPNIVLLPIIVIIIEAAIPCLLSMPATRHLGIRLGVVFNFSLAFTPAVAVFDFTATLFPLYFLFTADDFTERLRAALQKAPKSKLLSLTLRSLAFLATTAIIIFAIYSSDWVTFYGARRIKSLVFSTYGLFVCCVALTTVGPTIRWPFKNFSSTFVKPAIPQACVYLLVFSWVLLPYVGLRTMGVFTMFSNLRTEGGINNHMFLPRLKLWTLQDEFAEIQSASENGLQALAASKRYINYYELHRYVNEHAPEASFTYQRAGETHDIDPSTNQAAANLPPPPYLVKKFMLFRPVAIDGPTQCGN